MSATNDYELVLLDYMFSGTTYLALFTGDPGETGSIANEVTGGDYARKQVLAADMASAGSGSISNTNALTFVTASASWGTVSHWGICSASSGATVLLYGAFNTPTLVDTGDTANIAAGALTVSLT